LRLGARRPVREQFLGGGALRECHGLVLWGWSRLLMCGAGSRLESRFVDLLPIYERNITKQLYF
jgi:hypothetical protein